MKLVFFGTPKFAIPSLLSLHKSGHEILAVVTAPDKKRGRGLASKGSIVKEIALKLGYSVYQPHSLSSDSFIKDMKKINADIYVVVSFKILPEVVIKLPIRGAVNIHASILPKYRGPAPIHHAILNGENETGVTSFEIQKEVDTGKILLQKKYNIDKNITTGEVYDNLAEIGGDLIVNTLDGLYDNSIIPIKQDHKYATPAPKISSDHCKINWHKSAESIHNHIRAFSPRPGSYTFYNSKRIKLFTSLNETGSSVLLLPGQIRCIGECLEVGTGRGIIKIYELQLEGKKRMSVKECINGLPNLNGTCFG